jgi:hypothetical protein
MVDEAWPDRLEIGMLDPGLPGSEPAWIVGA